MADNLFGLDADYFIRLFARELNPDVVRNQTPDCLARVLARAARTACAEVLAEPEFQPGKTVAQAEQPPVAIANKGDHAFWVRWTEVGRDLRGPGIKLYAGPNAQAATLRYTNDGALAECPCCESLDVGGAPDTVHCYRCGLTVTKPRPLQNAIDAWNMRAGRKQAAPKSEQSGLVEALLAAIQQTVHDERVPNEVSQELAAVLITARAARAALAAQGGGR